MRRRARALLVFLAVLGYSGRSGDGARGGHLLSVGLHIAF